MRVPFAVPAAEARAFDVVTFGENSIDLVAVVAEYPESNTKQRLQRFSHLPGGQMATAAAACARLGWRARYVGSFGDDRLGAMARASLEAEGVDLTASWTMPDTTNRLAIVLVDVRSGDRTVLWDRHPLLTIAPGAVPRAAVESARILIVDCQDTAAAARAAAYARAAGIPTIVDVERVGPGITDLLQHVDALIATRDFPAALTGCDEPGRALRAMADEFHSPLVAMTLGAEGSLALCGGQEIFTPGFAVDCLDTTGAGDAFRAGLAAGCLRWPDGNIEDALTYANAVAALNCRGFGAQGAMPTAGDVERVLMARGH